MQEVSRWVTSRRRRRPTHVLIGSSWYVGQDRTGFVPTAPRTRPDLQNEGPSTIIVVVVTTVECPKVVKVSVTHDPSR